MHWELGVGSLVICLYLPPIWQCSFVCALWNSSEQKDVGRKVVFALFALLSSFASSQDFYNSNFHFSTLTLHSLTMNVYHRKRVVEGRKKEDPPLYLAGELFE